MEEKRELLDLYLNLDEVVKTLIDEIELTGDKDGRSREVVIDLPEEFTHEPPRDPIVDLYVYEGMVHVTSELLGIDAETIQVDLADQLLLIHATGGADIHTREIWLPVAVEQEGIEKRYKNGVLEVTLKQRTS